MATAEEILQSMAEAAENAPAFCVIDPETRTIAVPPEYQLFGVENDKRVERLYFQCPKIVGDNQDLSQGYQLFMNYQNANGDLDAYHIDDMEIDGDNITFSWLLEENVTKYRGNIQFAFGAIKPGDEAEDPDKNRWNTTINADCTCLVGLKSTQQVAESNPDALAQIWAAIDKLKAGGGGGGTPGVGIDRIEKTKTEGFVDTYTIYLTDESAYTFTVTNGKDGDPGNNLGYDEDNKENYAFSTKIKNGDLIGVLQYEDDSPTGTGLDSVAINGKTYREIFVDGNKIHWGDFESGSEGFNIGSGTPELSEEECVSKTHSLKAFGEISQQYRIGNAYSHTNSTNVYIALKAKCDRYTKGTLGFNNGSVTVGATNKTNGFETFSVIDTVSGIKSCFIGSISSANLDGYVDDIVVINITEIFGDSVPEKEMLDNAYNNYISIITSDSDNIPSVASAPKTEEYILSSNKHIEYTDTECVSAFMDLVNRKAEYYGMANSNFTSPSGAGGNTSCAKDLAIAGYYACGYRDILDVWKHKQYDVKVYGPNEREINVRSTVMNTPIGDYTVHGGKTGSWAGTENLLVVAEVNNEVFACVVMDCGSSQNRFVAMGELLDVISSSSGEVSTASAACVYKIPAQIPQLHNISEETAIYTKNDTQEIIPASVTKVMTAITALDYADSLSEKILFKPSDLESGSGAIFQAGDIITLNDALVAMLLPSSNMAATAIARNIGKLYLEKVGNRKA